MGKGSKSAESKRDGCEITGTAFAVVELAERDDHGRAQWAPLKVKIDAGIVVGVELCALDSTDVQAVAYQYLAGAVVDHGAEVCAGFVRPRECDHPPAKIGASTGRLTAVCEACGATQHDGGGPWYAPKAQAVAHG